jgi:hypothetical protein
MTGPQKAEEVEVISTQYVEEENGQQVEESIVNDNEEEEGKESTN